MITSNDIQAFILKHWLLEHHNPYTIANFSSGGYHEADVLAISRAGVVTEFEIKMSRGDFFADFKKTTKHSLFETVFKKQTQGNLPVLASSIPNKFYYACPKGLIKPQEVPEYAGLIYFTKFHLKGSEQPYIEFSYERKAPYIHRGKPEESIYKLIASSLCSRMILGCALMTYKNRETQAQNERVMQEAEQRQNERGRAIATIDRKIKQGLGI